jgi:hypothetical protein
VAKPTCKSERQVPCLYDAPTIQEHNQMQSLPVGRRFKK